MKAFNCGAVVPGCTAKFQADTEEELMVMVREHGRSAHGIEDSSAEALAEVRRRIRTA